ncbi:MAG: hydroxymethylbilane synthase [Calditrichia bacterium]
MKHILRLGTRGSTLALWQTDWVKKRLAEKYPEVEFQTVIIKTTGDKILDSPLSRIGDKGLFTRELDQALLDGRIDLAVHSMKDVPTQYDAGLTIGAVTERWDVRDALISREGKSLDDLPEGAIIATGSLRRKAQLLHLRPDFTIVDIRGNLQTRLQKFDQSDWQGMILATAGLERLNLHERISQRIPTDIILPAVGQGCFAVMLRRNDEAVAEMLQAVHCPEVAFPVFAERALLRTIEGGCQVPLGAFGEVQNGGIMLRACIASLDGKKFVKDQISGPLGQYERLGKSLAEKLIAAGGDEILREIRSGIDAS